MVPWSRSGGRGRKLPFLTRFEVPCERSQVSPDRDAPDVPAAGDRSRPHLGGAYVVGAAALVVYFLTLYPSVAGGDSGELIGAVGSGGVIHPPGYPAYALLGLVFAKLPFGNLAWRCNLLSAVCDALAAALLFVAARIATRSMPAAWVTAILFALAPGVWRYAIVAEVFALDNLFVASLLLLAVLYVDRRERPFALGGAFVFGLGLSNHHTIVFTAAPLAAWVLASGWRDLGRPGVLVGLVVAFAAGLSPYAYLPLAARHHAVVSWGATDTWPGFLTHVLRREYGTFQLAPNGVAGPSASGIETVEAWLSDLLEQVGVAGGALAVLGLSWCAWASSRDSKTGPFRVGLVAIAPVLLSVGVLAALGNLPVGDALHRGIVARFWQQPDLFVCLWCGFGVASLGALAPAALTSRIGRRLEVPAAVALGATLLGLRFASMDRAKSTLVRDYGSEILRAAPRGSLLLTKGDLITNTVRYLQLADNERPDVRVVDLELLGLPWMKSSILARYPDVVIPGGRYMPGAPDGFDMKRLLDANVGRSPVLLCGGVKAGDASADAAYGRWPWGFCEWVHRGTEAVSLDAWVKDSEAALPRIDFSGQPHPQGSWEDVVWGDFWEVQQDRAAQLLRVSGRDDAKHKYLVLAGEILAGIVERNPAAPAHIYKNLAVALGRAGLDTPAQRARVANAWRHYLDRAPQGDPQRGAIEAELRRLESDSR
jgi:hypothetical protein